MQRLLFSMLILWGCSQVTAQNSFSATPDSVVAIKPSTYFVFYNYTQFENLTDESMDIKWEQIELTTSLGGSELGDWQLAINDPENQFLGNIPDSATFNLGTEVLSTDKFIFQLLPNNQPGWLYARYKFYPVQNPEDSVVVTFDYIATDSSTPTHSAEGVFRVEMAPNPASSFCKISNQTSELLNCELFSANGRTLEKFSLPVNGNRELDVSGFENGVYYLQSKKGEAVSVQRIVVSR